MSKKVYLRRILSMMLTVVMLFSSHLPVQVSAAGKSMSLDSGGCTAYAGYSYRVEAIDAPGKVTWTTTDEGVASAVSTGDNSCVVIMKAPGTCTLKAESGKSKATANLTVMDKSGFPNLSLNEITLYPDETFKLFYSGAGKVKWYSSNKKVAKVSKGVVTALKAGTAVITAKCGDQKLKCKVKVVKRNQNVYMSPASYGDVQLSTNFTSKEYDKFILVTGPDMYIPEDLPETIERAMNDIEKATGLKYYPEDKPVTNSDRKITVTFYRDASTCTTTDGPIYSYQDLYDNAYAVIVHELCHSIQAQNSCDLGSALCEGFAEYYTELIATAESGGFNDAYTFAQEMKMEFDPITADNAEQNLLYPTDVHPFSYFFVRYIVETYGEEKLSSLMRAINKAGAKELGYKCGGNTIAFETEEQIYDIIKANTSKKLTANFYKWYSKFLKKLEQNTNITEYAIEADASGTSDIESLPVVKPYFVQDNHKADGEWWVASPQIKGEGDVLIDFNELLAYTERICGAKVKGLSLYIGGTGTADFYDNEGKLIRTEEVNSSSFEFKDAVRVVVHLEQGYGTTFTSVDILK